MNALLPAAVSSAIIRSEACETRAPAIRATVQALFDRTFYLAAYPDVAQAGVDALEHFLECGMNEGRSPHALFDVPFYAAQMPAADASEPPFLHYLRKGGLNRLDPHPLFDTAHYLAQADGGIAFNDLPLLHFLTAGTRAQLSPNPLFDAAYYRRVNGIDDAHPRHPLHHYIEDGWRNGCRTHPLFDPAYYAKLRPDIGQAGIDPLAHFLRQGLHETPSTHEFFDAGYYRAAYSGRPAEQKAIDADGGIIHYASNTKRHPPSPHPLFERAFYARTQCGLRSDGAGYDPFLHFLEHGLGSDLDPHPLFDAAFYRRRYPDIASLDDAPILHFIRHGAREQRDPNSLFDAAAYVTRHPDAQSCAFGALSHYLAHDNRALASTSARFDPVFYADCLDATGEAASLDPLAHFQVFGRHAGYAPVPPLLSALAWRGAWQTGRAADARPVLLITPDATDQPVSLCALRAAQQLAGDQGVAFHVALRRGGVMAHEFAAVAPTLLLKGRRDMVELLHAFRAASPDGIVVVNTATMPDVGHLVSRLGLKLLAWLHEMPVSIDSLLGGAVTMQTIAASATRIVTVSHHAHDAFCRRYGLAGDEILVLGNGGEQVGGPDASIESGIAVRVELRIPPDAVLVLGGGAVDFGSGADLFIKIARQVLLDAEPARDLARRPVYFVWVGEEPDPLFSGLCRHDVQQLDLSDRVRFLSAPLLMRRLLPEADMFLMTARAEAFDSAAMEAAGLGLPVIAFAGCVSPADLPADSGTSLVPYLDVAAMARAVITQAGASERRRAVRPADRAAPSWAHWHAGLRLILERDFGFIRQDAGGAP